MKHTYIQIKEVIIHSQSLSNIQANGRITFAIVSNLKVFKTAYENFIDTRKTILESRCKKSKGAPILDEKKQYTFESDTIQKSVSEDITNLMKQEVELFGLQNATQKEIQQIYSITAQQMEILMLLIPIEV